MPDIKARLHTLCTSYAETRIATAIEAIHAAREAAEADEKSSAGDKYETTREMMQQEIGRNQQQLTEARKLQTQLQQPGRLVITDNSNYYVAISAGQFSVDGERYFAISPLSPLGRVLAIAKPGDTLAFQGKTFRVSDVL